ncbi:MAG: 23S rRNA (adenine(2503)-C(2))-methyltransferase RlmN [Clostridia bacterium]|jgi:23S rRNA (adenine2503-C2)-methyltransferase|nr:23S rRNA (adenine(2503)-C(2))-methyltransferase RlmN [Clostridia bacterium]
MDIRNLTHLELEKHIIDSGFPKFRTNQIFDWVHNKGIKSFEDMKNIPKDMQEKLSDEFNLNELKVIDRKISKEDYTEKYLFELHDGNVIECVLMKYKHGNTICISSQVGCRMGCEFCASTKGGLVRNLEVSEMLAQIYEVNKLSKVSNIVIMGIGEPFDNYENILKFLEIINSEKGLNIGQRHITLSTCGLVDKIKMFADLGMQVNLAISLHAVTDDKRKSLMKIANKYSIEELIESIKYYIDKTNRRVTFEYALIDKVNDSKKDAEGLAKLIRGINCHVNLIPMNEIEESEFKPSKNLKEFTKVLDKRKINYTVRRKLGNDIEAACGQLRKKYVDEVNGDA